MRPDYEDFRDVFNGLEQTQIDFETQCDGEVRGRQSSQRQQHSEGYRQRGGRECNRAMLGQMKAVASQGPLLLLEGRQQPQHQQRIAPTVNK